MRLAVLIAAMLSVTACASTGERQGPGPEQPPAGAEFSLTAADFSDLPNWASADLSPAFIAFRRTCEARAFRGPNDSWSNYGRYGGTMATWSAACAASRTVAPGGERAFFESQFSPFFVRGPGEARLTAYYEPAIQASRIQAPGFTEPLLRKPNDMVSIDLAGFAEALDNDTLRGAPRALTGQLRGSSVVPYPKRDAITQQPGQVIAWAHPVDVYNLQIQGSGRLVFGDSAPVRAQYAAQNGYGWNSALGALSRSGELQGGATWANFRAWSDQRGTDATRTALNADPSYVFFEERTIADPSIGPEGAAGIALQPQGSLAVDPSFHPYGAVIYVDGQYDGAAFNRLLVALDTGGAIRRGPLRGDVFWGSGLEAGQAAERMNAPARWWTLLPRGAPIS
ncbi:MAG: MltA domain-containing protein [Hyphomonadaceae bacterium]|nr:MltA domain-containing protein [Hyphomonadaceae bacterium]